MINIKVFYSCKGVFQILIDYMYVLLPGPNIFFRIHTASSGRSWTWEWILCCKYTVPLIDYFILVWRMWWCTYYTQKQKLLQKWTEIQRKQWLWQWCKRPYSFRTQWNLPLPMSKAIKINYIALINLHVCNKLTK